MNLSDFDYHLPKDLIAAFPPEDRASARLLKVNRQSGEFSHHTFRDIVQFLKPGDLLILNNTKVLPARLFGRKPTGGTVETLLLNAGSNHQWEALVRPNRRVKKGTRLLFGNNGAQLEATVLDVQRPDSGQRTLQFIGENIQEKIREVGHIPLPPYLDREDTEIDRTLYQTVFAQIEGAVASPTAGLHFDQALLETLKERGVEIAYVTLHVSYGTFQTISSEDPRNHQMDEERFEISQETASMINRALREKRRVVACGTTSVRTLESSVDNHGHVVARRGKTRLFVYPPYRFQVVRGLITNFHLPKSSLLLLVSAFLQEGHLNPADKLFQVYQEAIREKYRFYSYGDAMVILGDES